MLPALESGVKPRSLRGGSQVRSCRVRSMFRSVLAGFSLFLFCMPSAIRAQAVAVAQISGIVFDPSGKSIPGAQVTMTETDKQTVHTVATDGLGSYTLPNLPVGPYRLEVTNPGFKNYVQSGLVLQVGNNIQVNVSMQVGAVSEKVEVNATASLVETRENSISYVIDQQRINELPLNGRQATQLIITLGAAVYGDSGDTGSKTFYSSTRISVAGGQGNGTAYLLDGGDNTDAMSNVNLPFPFPDALQEFSVETSAVSSRFGTHPGATVNVVTKSGTNQLHGDIFDYFRNGDLNARNFFAAKHDGLKRNQYGGTAGGRIIKDKLFFFGGYQGTRTRQDPAATPPAVIPTAQMLAGDFTAFASCYKLNLPSPFVDNKIDPALLSKAAVNISKRLPTTNNPCGTFPYGIITDQNEYQIIGRVDYSLSARHSVFGRYIATAYKQPTPYSIEPDDILVTTTGGRDNL